MPRRRVTKPLEVTTPLAEDNAGTAADDAGPGEEPQDPATLAEVAADLGEAPEELKIVIHLRPPNAMIGVSQPGKDPHLVSLEMAEVQELEQVLVQVSGIVELARLRWAAAPQYPKYTRPAPPPPPARPAPVSRTRRGASQTTPAQPAPVVQAPRMF